MRQVKILRPHYAEAFQCIGSECPDDCCTGWQVGVDRTTFERYSAIQSGELFPIVQNHVLAFGADDAMRTEQRFARIEMMDNGKCPFLNEAKLCRIHAAEGHEALSATCRTFPRMPHRIDGLAETGLSLSCPEAARMILLDGNLSAKLSDGQVMRWLEDDRPRPDLRYYFWHIREFALELVADRRYALWQRVFLLGSFANRLEMLATGRDGKGFPAFLREFTNAVRGQAVELSRQMEAAPRALGAQFQILRDLIDLRLADKDLSRPLLEYLQKIGRGMGLADHAAETDKLAAFEHARAEYLNPLLAAYPHLLENYLTNQICRRLFPFGGALHAPDEPLHPLAEFGKLAAQLALVQGLLVGMAGFERENFSTPQSLTTISKAYRYFEHHNNYFDRAMEMLAARGLNNPAGLAMLVRG